MTTSSQQALVRRVHALLVGEPDVREVAMFGGRSIMVRDKMIVSVGKDGSLLVRVAAEQHEQFLHEPGVTQAEMGNEREMGPGWLTVSSEVIADDEGLAFWVEAAMIHNHTLTEGR